VIPVHIYLYSPVESSHGYLNIDKCFILNLFDEFNSFTVKEPVYIIYSNRHEMRRVDLDKFNYASLVSGLRNTIALDFYYNQSWIFWTDVVDDKIFRGKILSNSKYTHS
jgi:hypothetical protein